MATNPLVCAVLPALLSLSLLAQDPGLFEQHLAAAKLAQTRGDFAAAIQELRKAQEIAPADQKEQLQRAARSLADSQAGVGTQDPQTGDPVRRLIAVLDTGSRADAAVYSAYEQLSYLGALAVPPLLDAVPNFGPFGLRNALLLLAGHDDARIAQVLTKRMDDTDPAVTAAIVESVDDARPTVAVPLAAKVAAISKDPGQLLIALRELTEHDRENPAARAAAEKVMSSESPKVLAKLIDAIDDCSAAWVPDVLDRLRQRGDDKTRALATYYWLQRQPELTQDRALDALQQAPAGSICWIAAHFAQRSPTWNRVALLALRSSVDEAVSNGRPNPLDGLREVKWGELRDEAGAAMLAVPRQGHERIGQLNLLAKTLIDAGWTVPQGQEGSLIDLLSARGGEAVQMLLAALPKDDEARALRAYSSLPREHQHAFAVHVAATRQWPRILATELLAAEQNDRVNPRLLRSDWTGAPREVFDALAELATRWPTPPIGSDGWQPVLVAAWSRTPDMPAEVILPLIEAGNQVAWQALGRRDPERALTCLRNAKPWAGIDPMFVIELLRKHGGPADIATAIWVVNQLAGIPPSSLPDFLAAYGSGNLDVIALSRHPLSAHPNMNAFCNQVSQRAAIGARADDLVALLALVPELWTEPAHAVMQSLQDQMRPEHGPTVMEAIERAARRDEPGTSARPIGNFNLLFGLLQLAGATRDTGLVPRLRSLMEGDFRLPEGESAHVRGKAATTCLQLADTGRRDLLTTMFASSRPETVAAAMLAEELRTDEALRALARAAIFRLRSKIRLDLKAMPMQPLDLDHLAVAIVDDAGFPATNSHLAASAVGVLRARKDTTFLSQLARAATHPANPVRKEAAIALGFTFSREAAPVLLELLKDDSGDVQKAAQDSLDRIANYLEERKKWEERLK